MMNMGKDRSSFVLMTRNDPRHTQGASRGTFAGSKICHQVFGAAAQTGDSLAVSRSDKSPLERKNRKIFAPGFRLHNAKNPPNRLQPAATVHRLQRSAAFGYMKIIARQCAGAGALLRGLGPERSQRIRRRMLARSLRQQEDSLKAALLDQRVVAGLGNIYVCEALFRSHLSPRRLGRDPGHEKGRPTDHANVGHGDHAVLNQAIKAASPRCAITADFRRTRLFQALVSGLRREGEKCQTAAATASSGDYAKMGVRPLVPEVPEVTNAIGALPGRESALFAVVRLLQTAPGTSAPQGFQEYRRDR